MAVDEKMDPNLQSIRRISSEEPYNTEHEIVASSTHDSVDKKWSNMSVHSLHGSTSQSAAATSVTNLSPSVSHERPASWRSQDARSSSSSNPPSLERAESLAKTLMVRGSKLFKRQHSKTSPPSLRTLYWVVDTQNGMEKSGRQRGSLHRDSQHNRMHSTGNIGLRPRISEPYNFQHLTHTKANQFQKLDEASHGELAYEFSAIRASQAPQQGLRGIKAESLQNRNRSSELITSEPSCFKGNSVTATSPKRPRRPQPHRLYISEANMGSPLSPRSVDNFSQPSPRSYKSAPPPITPPPRVSSRRSTTDIFIGLHNSPVSPSFQPRSHEMLAGSYPGDPPISPAAFTPVEWEDDLFDYTSTPHAVTTLDETALTLNPLSFGPSRSELPNVPEEDEAAVKRKDSSSRVTDELTELVQARSSPSLKSCSFRWSSSSSRASAASPTSPLSEDSPLVELVIPSLGQSSSKDDVTIRPRSSRPFSPGPVEISHCWEDDIDYCYDHAAEADCDFDWDRLSVEDGKFCLHGETDELSAGLGREVRKESNILVQGVGAPSSGQAPINIPSLFDLRTLDMSVPDLEPSSRHSTKSSTVSLGGPITPSYSISPTPHILMPLDQSKIGAAAQVSATLPPHAGMEPPLAPGVMYQKLLAVEQIQEPKCLLSDSCDPPNLGCGFAGNSFSASSKSCSQESFFNSPHSHVAERYFDKLAMASLPDFPMSMNRPHPADISTDAAKKPSSSPAAEPILGSLSCPPLRPRRSQNLAKGIARQSILQKFTGFSWVSSQHEKPLPLAPPYSQPNKPLPSPPRPPPPSESVCLDGGSQLLHEISVPSVDSDVSNRSPTSNPHLVRSATSQVIDPAPFGFFPSMPLELPA